MLSLRKIGKDPVTFRVPEDHIDPLVDYGGCSRNCEMRDMVKWHPYIREGDLPTCWLEHYVIVPLVSAHAKNQLGDAVHFLNHSLFEDGGQDRVCISPSLRKCETIAVFKPDKDEAISAVTFSKVNKRL